MVASHQRNTVFNSVIQPFTVFYSVQSYAVYVTACTYLTSLKQYSTVLYKLIQCFTNVIQCYTEVYSVTASTVLFSL